MSRFIKFLQKVKFNNLTPIPNWKRQLDHTGRNQAIGKMNDLEANNTVVTFEGRGLEHRSSNPGCVQKGWFVPILS